MKISLDDCFDHIVEKFGYQIKDYAPGGLAPGLNLGGGVRSFLASFDLFRTTLL